MEAKNLESKIINVSWESSNLIRSKNYAFTLLTVKTINKNV